MNATEYILDRAERRAFKKTVYIVLIGFVFFSYIAFQAGRVYEYAAGYAVKAADVDAMLQKELRGE